MKIKGQPVEIQVSDLLDFHGLSCFLPSLLPVRDFLPSAFPARDHLPAELSARIWHTDFSLHRLNSIVAILK